MANIETSYQGKHPGVSRRKKLSTRVDLTPMVDLGFLLITFFIFTTSIAQPVAMSLAMPDDNSVIEPMHASEKKTLTLVVGEADRIFYYNGIFTGELTETTYDAKGIRKIMMNNKQQVKRMFNTNDLLVLIKLTKGASYKNIVTCLDEILINDVAHYMLLDASREEAAAITAH